MLDPFGGSGSTLIACEKTGRQARLIELDPKDVDGIIRRWQAFSGGAAILGGEGTSFEKVDRGRGGPSGMARGLTPVPPSRIASLNPPEGTSPPLSRIALDDQLTPCNIRFMPPPPLAGAPHGQCG